MTEEEINICKLLCTGEKHNIELAILLVQGLGLKQLDFIKQVGYFEVFNRRILCFDEFISDYLPFDFMFGDLPCINNKTYNIFVKLFNMNILPVFNRYIFFRYLNVKELPFNLFNVYKYVTITECFNLGKLPNILDKTNLDGYKALRIDIENTKLNESYLSSYFIKHKAYMLSNNSYYNHLFLHYE
jgi:hypothetical protein